MALSDLLQKTVEFIDGGWHERQPIYTENPQKDLILKNCRGCEDAADLIQPIKYGIEFSEITEGAQRLTLPEAIKRLNKNIPNSRESQLIDFCSGTGVYFTYGFAKRHPETRVLMVDKIEPEQLMHMALTQSQFEKKARNNLSEKELKEIVEKGFERYDSDVPKHANIPKFMDELFIANKAHNMHYLHMFAEEFTIPKDKKTYCTGWNCPANAGVIAIEKATESAEAIAIAISGMEHLTKSFGPMVNVPKRMDYGKPEERRLGFAYKNLRALDALQWLEKKGYNTRLVILDLPDPHYNNAEHLIYAYKKDDVLA